jgi:hypothetical protein
MLRRRSSEISHYRDSKDDLYILMCMSSPRRSEWRCGRRTIIEKKLNIFLYIKYFMKINAKIEEEQ